MRPEFIAALIDRLGRQPGDTSAVARPASSGPPSRRLMKSSAIIIARHTCIPALTGRQQITA